MHDAGASSQPLHVPAAETRRCTERIRVVDEALTDDGHRFEAAVGVLRKTRHDLPVVHAEAVLPPEILAEYTARQRHGWPEALVSGGVRIVVVDAKQERIRRDPWKSERNDFEHTTSHRASVARPGQLALCSRTPGDWTHPEPERGALMHKKIAVFWPGDARDIPNQRALPNMQEATTQLERALKKL